jgi:hypothetical protein
VILFNAIWWIIFVGDSQAFPINIPFGKIDYPKKPRRGVLLPSSNYSKYIRNKPDILVNDVASKLNSFVLLFVLLMKMAS